jgi:hypothetical protein
MRTGDGGIGGVMGRLTYSLSYSLAMAMTFGLRWSPAIASNRALRELLLRARNLPMVERFLIEIS